MKHIKLIILTTIVILISPIFQVYALSLTGSNGLLYIPTAQMQNDRHVKIGMTWLNKESFAYGEGKYNGLASFATIGYLPFMEISLRLTRKLDFPEIQALGDRMIIIRIRPIKEGRVYPAVVFGAHDFIWSVPESPTNEFNALYAVASKTLVLESVINKMGLHLGYGSDLIKAKHREFVGLFGGVDLYFTPNIALMMEHDSSRFNWGAKLSLFNKLEVVAALLDFSVFSAGMNFRFSI
ncbi:hypothetical protein GF312_15310 [Candidatus Poribacteria bacterium]|nr:hypothetical protein [Candidatus Poribacteria bacterium]